jgi:hypothetical protein
MSPIEEISLRAQIELHKNQECYMAQWILQNPIANLDDYVLVTQSNWSTGEHRFWMEKK